MKTIYLVFDKETKHVVGAYSSPEILQFEVLANSVENKYNLHNLFVKKEEDVPDEVYDRLINQYQRKSVWN